MSAPGLSTPARQLLSLWQGYEPHHVVTAGPAVEVEVHGALNDDRSVGGHLGGYVLVGSNVAVGAHGQSGIGLHRPLLGDDLSTGGEIPDSGMSIAITPVLQAE